MNAVEDAALEALARALAPRVARLLREPASADPDLIAMLARVGYELDESEGDQPAPSTQAKPVVSAARAKSSRRSA